MAAGNQQFEMTATIGGTTVGDLIGVSGTAGRAKRNSAFTISCLSVPGGISFGDDVQVSVNGALLWRGDYTGVAWSLDQGRTITLACTGILARLRRPWGGAERVYSADLTAAERVDAAVIRNLIEAYGIPAARHRIFASEWLAADGVTVENWLLGAIQPVVLNPGEPAIDLIDQIDGPPGFITYDQPTGFIDRTRNSPGYAHPTPTFTLIEGQDGVSIRRAREVGPIVNKVIFQGLTYQGIGIEGVAELDNATLQAFYPPELPNARVARTIKSDLIEYQHYCDQAAYILMQDDNRVTDGLELVLAGDPNQQLYALADTIQVQYPDAGTSSSRHRIEDISDDASFTSDGWSWTRTLRTNGGTLV